jgi:hypothetical protein
MNPLSLPLNSLESKYLAVGGGEALFPSPFIPDIK